MKKIRKWVTAAVSASLLFSLAACGSSSTGNETSAETGSENEIVAGGDFPTKPVRLVIPYPPGGGTDVLFRLVASYAEEHLGQTIVPTNMAGATATVGSRHVKDAEPDGYTVLGIHQVAATAYHTGIVDYGFDAFDPIMLMTSTPHIPAVSKKFSEENNVTDVPSFIEYVKANPNEVTWAFTTGSEDHYTIAAMLDAAGVDPGSLNYVNYDGTGPQYAALVANQVEGMTGDYASGKGYIEDGSMVPLGMVFDERNPFLPEVPTLIEQGIDFAVTIDRGVLAPKGTPADRIEIINDAFKKALEDPELQRQIEELGSFPNFMPTSEYELHLEELNNRMDDLAEKMQF
ncbi:tripartite tricarboxylate transporter substrate-binding protein [Alkalihalobacillus sp. MEB130]|uniref:Bug family tripartite tricarboxylate transporter substrate binding protein n=1 Tax=Alkalihalobacillus sp. MEB130 TaxID=2976704 RepID=UPI0028DE430D|nr:tripartite tricarboxylate transporter substrate-binding protein [Alkalihalobacillus sp. MEB130]MDT8860900.1 tripartite tricarboxylate transporter substrate-binding protein [Alkalihalobacillus sp. MEB130]